MQKLYCDMSESTSTYAIFIPVVAVSGVAAGCSSILGLELLHAVRNSADTALNDIMRMILLLFIFYVMFKLSDSFFCGKNVFCTHLSVLIHNAVYLAFFHILTVMNVYGGKSSVFKEYNLDT